MSTSARALASDCRAPSGCADATPDSIALKDGRVICGTIVHVEPERFLIIVSSHTTETIAWSDVECLDDDSAEPCSEPAQKLFDSRACRQLGQADQGRATTPNLAAGSARPAPNVASEAAADSDEAAPGGFTLAWDLRWVGHSLLKRYTAVDTAAWSWGLGTGVGFGVALHYAASRPSWLSRSIGWYELVLGLSGAVTYGTWHQVDGRSAAMIEQDLALVLGFIVPLGAPRGPRGGARWSGALLGLAWQPSYVDFYGREIDAHGAINPAGVRLSLDLGTISGPGPAPLWRITAAYLPYVGRLPSALHVGIGLAHY